MKRLALVLALAVVAAAVLAWVFWPRPPADDPLAAARADRARGDELLRGARQEPDKPDVNLLAEAAGRYRDCLAREADGPGAGPLFAGARHNLEMAKLLLAQAGRPDLAAAADPQGDGDKKPAGAGDSQTASGDPKNGKNRGPADKPSGKPGGDESASGKDQIARADDPKGGGDKPGGGKDKQPGGGEKDNAGGKKDKSSLHDPAGGNEPSPAGGEKPKPSGGCST
jgi:hypothetical protein